MFVEAFRKPGSSIFCAVSNYSLLNCIGAHTSRFFMSCRDAAALCILRSCLILMLMAC